MRREELKELHYITPITNVPSILQRGLLSHRRAAAIQHQSVAMPEIQDRRALVRVPGGRRLHEYVNLNFHARNPMLFKRRGQHTSLCVLQVSTDVLDSPGVVITDRNAAASDEYIRWSPSPSGLDRLNRDLVFAEDWRHPGDPIAYYRHRSIKCAEVLVPDVVPPHHIVGAYVSGESGRGKLAEVAGALLATVDAHLFFL